MHRVRVAVGGWRKQNLRELFRLKQGDIRLCNAFKKTCRKTLRSSRGAAHTSARIKDFFGVYYDKHKEKNLYVGIEGEDDEVH